MSNITFAAENDPLIRRDLALYYAKNGPLWMAVWGEWEQDPSSFEYVNDSYEILSAREFRGESG